MNVEPRWRTCARWTREGGYVCTHEVYGMPGAWCGACQALCWDCTCGADNVPEARTCHMCGELREVVEQEKEAKRQKAAAHEARVEAFLEANVLAWKTMSPKVQKRIRTKLWPLIAKLIAEVGAHNVKQLVAVLVDAKPEDL